MKKIMFLCTGNSCRSQMAEGWARYFWNDKYEVFSAGTHKHGMNNWAVKVMQEAGIDLSTHYSKTVEELPQENFDFVITVCDAAKETCPFFPGGKIIHVGFEDPPKLAENLTDEDKIIKIYRRVRDEIKEAVKKLPQTLEDIS